MADKDKENNYNKVNKDKGISRETKDKGKYSERNKDRNKEKSINEMSGKRDNDAGKTLSREEGKDEERGSDRRRKRQLRDRQRIEDKKKEDRERKARQEKVENLRNRRRAVQHYMNVAENGDDPLKEINWADKNLKSKDRRRLRELLEERGYKDREIYKNEKEDINKRIKDNKKENLKDGTKNTADIASMVSTGGLSAVLQIPSVIIGVFKMRKRKKENENLEKTLKWRRIGLILPTILIAFGLMIAGFLIITVGSQFVGTMLSHPEAIRELYDAGVLGDAMYMGNVTEDVVVDGEVIVKGNPNAQPGCFVYNGVWYCGGCLSTGGVEASSNVTVGGTGEVTGDMGEPMKSPYRITSNYGSRWGRLHAGIDLVGVGEALDVYATDGGKVSFVRDVCEPNSGFYPNEDPVCGGWGNYVVITHEGQPYKKTLYAHLNYVHVKEGDLVDKGQQLGIMGHTGNSTGAHLHFEIYEGDDYGSQIDPRKYIPSFPAAGQMK